MTPTLRGVSAGLIDASGRTGCYRSSKGLPHRSQRSSGAGRLRDHARNLLREHVRRVQRRKEVAWTELACGPVTILSAPAGGVGVPVGVRVGDGVTVGVTVLVGVSVPVAVRVGVGVEVAFGVAVAVEVGVWVLVGGTSPTWTTRW